MRLRTFAACTQLRAEPPQLSPKLFYQRPVVLKVDVERGCRYPGTDP